MFKRVSLSLAALLGLLAPRGAGAQPGSAYPFRDTTTTRQCYNAWPTTCAAGARSARDGSFAFDMRLESPFDGRWPGEARAYSHARFDLEEYVTPTSSPVTYRLTLSLGRAEAERTAGRPDLTHPTTRIDPDRDSGTAALSQVGITVRDSLCRCIAERRTNLIDTAADDHSVDDIVVLDVRLDGAPRDSLIGGWFTVDVFVGGHVSLGSEGPIRGDTGSIGQSLAGSVVVERIA